MFLETPRFPERIQLGSIGGPRWSTNRIVYGSGVMDRQANWSQPLHRYNISQTVQAADLLDEVHSFFMALQAGYGGFRLKDPFDYKSCRFDQTPAATDQIIGTGDGSDTTFQLIKSYAKGSSSIGRTIKKPVSGTVLLALDGVEQASGWSVDTTTGLVTFNTAPGAGVTVTAGFEFDVPVTFEQDELPIVYLAPNVLQITDLPLVELRNP